MIISLQTLGFNFLDILVFDFSWRQKWFYPPKISEKEYAALEMEHSSDGTEQTAALWAEIVES